MSVVFDDCVIVHTYSVDIGTRNGWKWGEETSGKGFVTTVKTDLAQSNQALCLKIAHRDVA